MERRQLEDLPKSALADERGRAYAAFRASLKPHWPTVAFDLALAYAMQAAAAALVVAGVTAAPGFRFLWIAAGALMFGFWMAFLQLFLHEAAHFNLCPGRRVNDLLANALIGLWVGTDIAEYRRIHWDHHRLLGQVADTERSYFSPLGWRFLLETLFLVAPLRVMLNRRKALARGGGAAPPRGPGIGMIAAGALAHGTILALCLWRRQFELAAAWVIGVFCVYPLFGALRQLLEHRGAGASASNDYSIVPHGKYTRSFKRGPFGSFFGGAGFRLHDIHHFDPELSYTNLRAVDGFLAHCEAARAARSARRSYAIVALELWGR